MEYDTLCINRQIDNIGQLLLSYCCYQLIKALEIIIRKYWYLKKYDKKNLKFRGHTRENRLEYNR